MVPYTYRKWCVCMHASILGMCISITASRCISNDMIHFHPYDEQCSAIRFNNAIQWKKIIAFISLVQTDSKSLKNSSLDF